MFDSQEDETTETSEPSSDIDLGSVLEVQLIGYTNLTGFTTLIVSDMALQLFMLNTTYDQYQNLYFQNYLFDHLLKNS